MIIPALLSDSMDILQSQIDKVAQTSITRVQIDIVDPDFADTVTIHPIDILDLQLHGLAIDVHLMTNDPINDVVECVQIPGLQTIIAQVERMGSQAAFVEHVTSYGVDVGLSLDRYTDVDAIEQSSYQSVSVVQIMGVAAGSQGQVFSGEGILEKIRTVAALPTLLRRSSFAIVVDGGMNPETIPICQAAGATDFAVGSYLWNAADLPSALEALTASLVD